MSSNQILQGALALLLTVAFISCKKRHRNIPFPNHETEYLQPVTEAVKFSEPTKFTWQIPDSLQPSSSSSLDFTKIPSKQIDMGDFRPFLKPIDKINLDFNHLPDTVFNINELPSQKLKFKTSILGHPRHVKALLPRLRDGATQAILELGPDQGLSTGGSVNCLLQDSKGFLWLGTLNGLYRFDGENFEIYTTDQGISFNNVQCIMEDRQGQIWIGTYDGGVDIIDPGNGTIKHLSTAQGLTNNNIQSLTEDSQGNFWISTAGGGVNIIDLKERTIKYLTTTNGLQNNFVTTILKDDQGQIWIGTKDGINIVDPSVGRLKRLTVNQGLTNNNVIKLFKDGNGRIIIGTRSGGVNVFDTNDGTLITLTTSQGLNEINPFGGLFSDDQAKIWVCTRKGVDIVDLKNGMIRHLTTLDGLGSNDNYCLLEDNQGHMWIGGAGSVDVIDLKGGIPKQFSVQHGLSNNMISGLLEDGMGQIWIGHGYPKPGVNLVDLKARKIMYFDSTQGLKIIPEWTVFLLEDNKEQIWISSDRSGVINIVDRKEGLLKHITVADGLNPTVKNLFKDSDGNIWISSNNGVYVYDHLTETIKHISKNQGLSNDDVSDCIEDNEGQIWIHANGGIDILDPKSETLRHLISATGQRIALGKGIFYKDSRGWIWISTYGYGLSMLDLKVGILTRFSIKEGLANNNILSVLEKNKRIYVGTSNGLTIITPPTNKESSSIREGNVRTDWFLKSYGSQQGFTYLDFNPRSALLNRKGEFWWGIGDGGIIIMNEPEIDTAKPPIYISGIDIMEQPQYFEKTPLIQNNPATADTVWGVNMDTFYIKGKLPPDTGYLQKNNIRWDSITGPYNIPFNLRLPYHENYIRFHFTGMQLGNADKTKYRYILEGKDKSWSPISEQPFASYLNLKPGKYTFKVSSRGFNGIWSNQAMLNFIVKPPWWKTWWAYLLFILFAGIIVWGSITVYRSRQLKKENLHLEEKVLQRTKELKHSLEELRETQTQLINQEKMASLGELTAGIAHEIQNPLNFVNNFSEVNTELIDELQQATEKGNLQEIKDIANDIKENEQKINHHGKRADAIVKGMLLHSLKSSGLKEPTDIGTLADEYLRLSYHGLRAKDKSFNATTKTDFDENIGTINIIPQDIGRVLLNLYNNAFYSVSEKKKQQPEGYEPIVSVSIKKIVDKVFIRVKDNGNGISQKVVDKIFQPFFTTKPTGQGTGLGLSMSYDIIKAHGGEIKVDTKEGEYSEFSIILPV